MTDISDDFCGQTQPHPAHTWTDPPLPGHMVVNTIPHQCGGHS